MAFSWFFFFFICLERFSTSIPSFAVEQVTMVGIDCSIGYFFSFSFLYLFLGFSSWLSDIEGDGEWIPGRIQMPLIFHGIRKSSSYILSIDLSDEGQGRVDARTNTGRCPDVPIDGPPCLALPLDFGPVRSGAGPGGLVRRRSLAVEHTGSGCQARARADGDEVLQFRIGGSDEIDGAVEVRGPGAKAAGNDQDVEIRGVFDRVGRKDA